MSPTQRTRAVKLRGPHAGYLVWYPEPTVPELVYFGEEWALPEYKVGLHAHRQHEFHLQLTGATQWSIGEEHPIVAGQQLIAVAPGHRHSWKVYGNRTHHFVYCSLDLGPLLARIGLTADAAWQHEPFFVIPDAEAFVGPLQTLSCEVKQNNRHRATIVDRATEMLACLLERHRGTAVQEPREPLVMMSGLAARIQHFIDVHLAEKLCIDTLAKEVGISRSVLFEAMKKELGISPVAYQIERRINRAKGMLRMETIPLTQIAMDLGFASSQHFSAAFRKKTGKTPSQYRNQWTRS